MATDRCGRDSSVLTKNRTIGLLGGSFNPAHDGHLHISLYALNTLGLDEVWWLVSPGNPLKSHDALAPYATRLAQAKTLAAHTRIRVSDIEAALRTVYTVDTVAELKARHPGTQFVWLMGADNLAQFHRWRKWRALFAMLPVVVFDRAPYSHRSQRSKAYLAFHKFILKNNAIKCGQALPALRFVHLRRHPSSSTVLRKRLEN